MVLSLFLVSCNGGVPKLDSIVQVIDLIRRRKSNCEIKSKCLDPVLASTTGTVRILFYGMPEDDGDGVGTTHCYYAALSDSGGINRPVARHRITAGNGRAGHLLMKKGN